MIATIDSPQICDSHDFSENAIEVMRDRYFVKDDSGNPIETPNDLFWRVARHIASCEPDESRDLYAQRFFEMMYNRKFMPNSPTLMNAGRPLGLLSACFVVPIPDNLEGIMDGVVTTAMIQRAGGGTGFTLDELRPSGSRISSSGGRTSGPLSFWRLYSEDTHAIQQGAFRRGANMMTCSVWHPDVIKFIFAKRNLSQFTNYNISVKVTDDFMRRVDVPGSPLMMFNKRSGQWYVAPKKILEHVMSAVDRGLADHRRVRDIDNCYTIDDLIPVDGPDSPILDDCYLITCKLLWDLLVENAHRNGEPGIIFIDRIRETEPTPHVGLIETTNPCAEQPLLPNESCNLGSINLDRFTWPGRGALDWEGLSECVRTAVRFLDNVIDVNLYPTQALHDMAHANRKIGLGIMGVADVLFKCSIPYNSHTAVEMVSGIMQFVNNHAIKASQELAEERGVFPNWSGSRWEKASLRIRNAEVTTIAPTGTISIVAGCSCGLEPLFSLAFTRNVMDRKLREVHPYFKEVLEGTGLDVERLYAEAEEHGSIQHLAWVPDHIRRVFVCAHDVSPDWHLEMQAACQKHVTNGVSKTVNLPKQATVEDVDRIMRRAHHLRCKAVSVYRDGSRSEQPMSLKGSDPKTEVVKSGPVGPREVPAVCSSIKCRQRTSFGSMHVHLTLDESNKPLEVFAQIGHAGSMELADLEAICRLASMGLRMGLDLTEIIRQLSGIRTGVQKMSPEDITSLPCALALALTQIVDRLGSAENHVYRPKAKSGGNGSHHILAQDVSGYKLACPYGDSCPGIIIREGSCMSCRTCGASTCV